MPYPNSTASVIVISQTSGSAVGGQYPFIERQISGSNLFLVTDANGNLTGSTSIPGGSFIDLTVSGELTASIISASNAITAAAITSGPITASNISSSGFLSASGIFDAGTLVVVGNSTLANLTASNISASAAISASTLFVANGIVDGGTLIVLGNTTLGDAATDITVISGSLNHVGSYFTNGSITASGNISSSGTISASIFAGVLSGSVFGSASWATNSLTASTLVRANSYVITNLTASNISASGFISASNGSFSSIGVGNTSTLGITNVTGLLSASAGVTASALQVNSNVGITSALNVGTTATIAGATTVNGLFSASAGVTASAIHDAGALTVLGNSILSTVTASNISASGTVSGSSGWFNNLTAVNFTGTATNALSTSVSANNSTATLQYITFVDGTGNRPSYIDQDSLTWQPSTNTLSSSGPVSASAFVASGNVAANGGSLTTTAATFNLANANATTINVGQASTTINLGQASTTTTIPGIIDNTNTTLATIGGAGAIQTDGGIYVGKNLIVSGSTTLYGDVTVVGTGSVVNISSSTIIIGDNRIQLNAWSVGQAQRYGGIDIFDSGSTTAVTSSLLWDSLNNYWLLQSNQSGSNPIVTSSAIILQGPTSSFGSEFLLTVNNFLKVQTETGNMITSSLSEVGNTLRYAGTISSSVVSGSTVFSDTGRFINLTIVTGSSPGVGNVPANPSDAGLPGQIEIDNNFLYVYANNLWKRVPLSIWSA